MREHELLTGLLKSVSRSFYLTLRVLPRAIRPQIGLAYLLARASDTIADTGLLPAGQRLEALKALRRKIVDGTTGELSLAAFASRQSSSAEEELLGRAGECLALLGKFSVSDQKNIRDVLATIISGQELDLVRFEHASSQAIVSLENDSELDDYTYRVAGCVGEFWTTVCREHLFPQAPLKMGELLEQAVRFGQGLQLVNILRDLPQDLRSGRCYIPAARLSALDLLPSDLLSPANEPRFRPIYDVYLLKADDFLAAGWDYTNRLPRSQMRVRLAWAWPVLIGQKTLGHLSRQNILASPRAIKIDRRAVRSLMARSVLLYPFQSAWRRQFVPLRSRGMNAVDSRRAFRY